VADMSCSPGTCALQYEFINSAFYPEYTLATEAHGIRIVENPPPDARERVADLATFRQMRQLTDETLVPRPPQLQLPLEGIEAGVPFMEPVSGLKWEDAGHRQHVSALGLVATGDGKLHVLITSDIVDGVSVRHPLGGSGEETDPQEVTVLADAI